MIGWNRNIWIQKMIYTLTRNKMNKITKLFAENYLNFRETSIQTFNDQQKADRKYSKIMPMTPENLEWCEKLQAKFPY